MKPLADVNSKHAQEEVYPKLLKQIYPISHNPISLNICRSLWNICKDFNKIKECDFFTLSFLMAEVMYHVGSEIKIFSGFNIVATYHFEGFI